ncbi:MAG TPA: acyl-CoA dehydrogenase family protein [Acidimicrobiales bacterium]|jgi:alkylation response protein AidB-like acyl-CoA dehydrogenase|nr:acyl-CoA dehydrogenase family protein [Acidimicrobiales bacterium]
MDLELTPEQELLRETVRGICGRHAGLAVVREMEDDPVGYPEKFWLQLAELGLLGMTLPEEWGGSGMSMLDAVVVYQELGRALAPSPHFVSSVICGSAIARAGSGTQRQEWISRVSSGEAILTPAWLEPGGGFGPSGVQLRAEDLPGGGWRLSGTKRHVSFARAADCLLVLARSTSGPVLLLVDPKAAGVELTQQFTIASDTQYRVDFREVEVGADALVGEPGGAWTVWDDVMHDGIILLAAQAVGGARYALDITVQYAKDRHQFDKPLGAFQAIAHYLADAVTTVDGAETLVYEAGWARAAGRPVNRLAPMAKLFACQTFRDVTAMAQQVFGGVGFTLDYDVQLYFRRAKQLQVSWWDTRYLQELVAADVLD